MNILNNKNKRISIFKALALCLFAAVSLTLISCDDDMDIQQSYPFTVETMPVPNKVTKGQTVEIRCELKKTGDFANTLYTIRYFQFEGEGTLKMDNGITFLPNDRYLLENKRISIFKALALCLFAAVSLTLISCDDDMDIQQSYPFTVETMPVPNKVTKGQTVEIRCELKKTGDFANTLYTIRYFQFEGEGTLKMDNGITFLPNDRYLLENEKFRLYYTADGEEAHNFIVVVEDNFGNSYELEFDFNNRNVKDDGVITVVPIGNFKPLTR